MLTNVPIDYTTDINFKSLFSRRRRFTSKVGLVQNAKKNHVQGYNMGRFLQSLMKIDFRGREQTDGFDGI